MKRITALLLALAFCLGLTASARADTTYPITGLFTMLDQVGSVVKNGLPYQSSPPYYGFHTPFSAFMTQYSTPPGDGSIGYLTPVSSFYFYDQPMNWQGTLYEPGTYTFNGESFTVSPNFIGAHIVFDWGGVGIIDQVSNIDIVLQLDPSGTGMSLFPDSHGGGLLTDNDGPFDFASTDDDGDGILGHPMWNGPFVQWSALMDLNVVPEPASFLLVGTGLAGLLAVVRRRKGM